MCGIVGRVAYSEGTSEKLLGKMAGTLVHRGPDSSGMWLSQDRKVAMAHRRLAVIDLSDKGQQPMWDGSGSYCIVFNGEAYNFRELRKELEAAGYVFLSNTDTEVVLQAYIEWGEECLERIEGMFAFAIYNKKEETLFLARDRVGEKPLFYYHNNRKFIFASELKAIIADDSIPRNIDLKSFQCYLAYGYVPGPHCMIESIQKVLPGHALFYDIEEDSIRESTYWQLPEKQDMGEITLEDAACELEELLLASVKGQLIADVPVGVLLSGGLDSSLVTAMAIRVCGEPIKTFTVSFAGYTGFDEGPYAKTVAEYFGTEHFELTAELSMVDILPEIAAQLDEPIGDHAVVPMFLLSKLAREHVTVALTGDGGDELFGGYDHYRWLQIAEKARYLLPSPVRQCLGKLGGAVLPIGTRGRNHLIGLSGSLADSIAHVNMYFDAGSRRRLLRMHSLGKFKGTEPEEYKKSLCPNGKSALQQASISDFKSTLVDGYLVKVDRASMASSLEIRCPWLARGLVEFAFAQLPDGLKVTRGELKRVVRNLGRRVLPSELDVKRKQGFTMPLRSWFMEGWDRHAVSILERADPDVYDLNEISRLIRLQQNGYSNTNRIFALTLFELWRTKNNISFPV